MVTELKNDCACVTSDPVDKAVGAKISTWATHSRWKTIKSLDFAVKFQSVFRHETVVFRRYVLALLLVVLLWKFGAYLVYKGLIWAKFPRRFLCFQKFRHFSYTFPGFPAQISDMRNRFSALSKMATSARNRPTMHCKPLSIQYVMYVYGMCLFYLILRLEIYI